MAKQNILNYLESETASFDEKPFSLLDSFVLAIASYFLFENAKTPRSVVLNEELPLLFESESKRTSYTDDAFDEQTLFPPDQGIYNFAEPVLVRAALASIEPKNLSNLFWFDTYAQPFLKALSRSSRFSALRVSDVAVDLNPNSFTQFAVMCFHVPDGSFYLSFRGTDSTITGWEEDFALSVLNPVPSQEYARLYTQAMMNKWLHVEGLLQKKPRHARIPALRLGGHSKGGNLAIYAATKCTLPLQPLITAAYSFDGPGVNPWQFKEEEIEQIKYRIIKVIPAHSIVGRIFDDLVMPFVVKSSELALMQHMPFSWEIERISDEVTSKASSNKPNKTITGKTHDETESANTRKENDKHNNEAALKNTIGTSDTNNTNSGYSFVYEGKNTLLSDSADLGLSRWIASLTTEDRIEFCSVLFGVVEYVSESNNIETLPADLLKKAPQVVIHLASLDEKTQEFAFSVIAGLLGDLAESFKEVRRKQTKTPH